MISSHLAEEQASHGASSRSLASISSDATNDRALGRTSHHVFTRIGPLARFGDITEHRTTDSARGRALARVPSDATDDGTLRKRYRAWFQGRSPGQLEQPGRNFSLHSVSIPPFKKW